jgi:purine-binding chemotaxis protein CheW
MTNDTAGGKSKSDLILEEIMRRKERERTVDVDEEKVKVVIFSLHSDYYAFYGKNIKEVLPLMTVYFVPGSADFIPGVINVRGEIESVVNINKFLGLPDSLNAQSNRIVLAVANGIRTGILVDAIEEVLDIPVSLVRPSLGTISKSIKEFVAGEFLHQKKNVTLLDIEAILGKIAG